MIFTAGDDLPSVQMHIRPCSEDGGPEYRKCFSKIAESDVGDAGSITTLS